ncbi:M20/M25/M40 family metallo-hydrolase [Sphingomonas sp. KC8]|uniref:M20/M25/M40 family metallo-hydrolase n=1 Tax=Sphingomonas sp. KC8 TaxID=1030157 RepID=UPI0002489317|nr:M20/M25/M40 family metallo-hydrolase [Sphingomonas sp. KC8]
MSRFLRTTPPLLLSALIAAQPLAARPAAETAIEARLRAHVDVLASDAMEGRKPGTPGGDMAVRYIAGQFSRIGLQPGGPDGSFYAPVALIDRSAGDASSEWRIGQQAFVVKADDLVLRAADADTRIAAAPIIYGGYGIDDDKAGLRNFDGVDVTGAVVLILSGQPEGAKQAPAFSERRDALLKAGAVAVLRIETEDKGWSAIRDALSEPRTDLADGPLPPITGALSPAAWGRIASAAGLDAAPMIAAAKPDFRAVRIDGAVSLAVRTALRPYTSWNVIGRLPGGDPAAGALLYLAHWDHLGICQPAGAPDRICNGAVDNASGVAMIVEVAQSLAADKKRPMRDLYFVATTAEEMGLLGAYALAKAPPVDPAKIAAVLNFDTVAIAPRGTPVAALGRGQTPLDPFIDAAARKLGRRINPSTDANVLTQRQDGWAFTRIGIPAVMVGGSLNLNLIQAYLNGPYHKPGDDLAQPLVLDGVAEDVRLHVALARRLADPRRYRPPPR